MAGSRGRRPRGFLQAAATADALFAAALTEIKLDYILCCSFLLSDGTLCGGEHWEG